MARAPDPGAMSFKIKVHIMHSVFPHLCRSKVEYFLKISLMFTICLNWPYHRISAPAPGVMKFLFWVLFKKQS